MALFIQRTNDRIIAYPSEAVQASTPGGGVSGVDWSVWFDHFWQAKGAADYATSKLDLVGAANLVEGNGAVPWNALTGWGFVAAALQWLDTGLTPGTNWSALVQFANHVAPLTRTIFGLFQAANRRFTVYPSFFGQIFYANGNAITVAPALLAGNVGFSDRIAYRNGIAEGAPMAIWGIGATLTVYIGARSRTAPLFVDSFITVEVVAMGIKMAPLTAPQMAAAATAMALL